MKKLSLSLPFLFFLIPVFLSFGIKSRNKGISFFKTPFESCINKNELFIKGDTLEKRLKQLGLVNVRDLDSSIVVDIRYSTVKNFFSLDFYGDFNKAYLHPEAAEKLHKAQQLLHSRFPYYNILVYDAARPVYIQKLMWNRLEAPSYLKINFLNPPEKSSLHNYGAAVDVALINTQGIILDMGTEYDDISELAYPSKEKESYEGGCLTTRQLQNRNILRTAMEEAGFMPIESEWWHFNSCTRKFAAANYPLIN